MLGEATANEEAARRNKQLPHHLARLQLPVNIPLYQSLGNHQRLIQSPQSTHCQVHHTCTCTSSTPQRTFTITNYCSLTSHTAVILVLGTVVILALSTAAILVLGTAYCHYESLFSPKQVSLSRKVSVPSRTAGKGQ